jgi:8-hydroxy-5-deazaflavin:NADPH oxidoreductase
MDPQPDISPAGVTRSRTALKLAGRTSSEMVAEMAVGVRLVKSISNMPMAWIQDFSPNKPRTVICTSDDDAEAKQRVIDLIHSTGLVAIDLGSLAMGDAMHDVGGPLSGLEFHLCPQAPVGVDRMPTDNSSPAPKIEGEVNAKRNP